ncbi:alpha/beta hydrolase [Streptomyces sp. PLK6-54]|uniref:Alpha/beta hydrolase n=2 Tax=Actinacidiphila acidipaludis TaxID=2873382 RepID=A0ABS7Q4Z4_9ACTN|nr:alpha/beta hydrolase [Streptomyces acidipaludis]
METTRTVPVAGGNLEVRVRDGSGPTLVFLHYWGGSADTWSRVLEGLPSGQATVRFDQRGWGGSAGLPGPYHLDRLADDLLQVADACVPGPFVVVGHSMGGKVAQLAAARRPRGLAGLVLVAPAPPRPPAAITEEYREGLSHAYDSAESVAGALDHVLTATALPAPLRAAAVRDSLSAGAEARREWPLHGIARDITGAARAIEVQVAVLAGENDVVEPPRVLRDHLLPHVPGAGLTVVPGAGHLLPLEAPDAVASALTSFLTSLHG